MNGLRECVLQESRRKFYDKDGTLYSGDVYYIDLDDGSMACVSFNGYAPVSIVESSNCIDDWERNRLFEKKPRKAKKKK